MFMAVMRNYALVVEKLLEIPDSAPGGACGWNALHAAVRNYNPGVYRLGKLKFNTTLIVLYIKV